MDLDLVVDPTTPRSAGSSPMSRVQPRPFNSVLFHDLPVIAGNLLRPQSMDKEIKQFAMAFPVQRDVQRDHLHAGGHAAGLGRKLHLECLS